MNAVNTWRERGRGCGLLCLRVLMGAGMAYHGYGKIFGGRMDSFAAGVAGMGFPLPEFFAWAAALAEFAGGVCIALGLGTRVAALLVLTTMLVAVFVRHSADPFKTKELALAYTTMALALSLTGPGALALDNLLCRWWRRRNKETQEKG